MDHRKADMSVRSHTIEEDSKVGLPEVELDAEGKPIKAGFGIKMPKFKGPDFHLPSLKGKTKGDVDLPEGDVTIAAPSADISVKGVANVDLPDAEVELDVDWKPKKGCFGIKMPKFKMPGFGVSAGAGSPSGGAELDAEISVKKLQVKGDLPEGKMKGEEPPSYDVVVAAPSAYAHPKGGVNVNLLDAELILDVDGKPKKVGFKMPKFMMPGFGVSAGTGSPSFGAEQDANASEKKASVKTEGPAEGRC